VLRRRIAASLIEPRTGPGHWQGASQGVSIPIYGGVRYRVGATNGADVTGDEQPSVIDAGTAVATDRRMLFVGTTHMREWLWAKCTSVAHQSDAPWTAIAVTNRQKVSGILYDRANAVDRRARSDLACATGKGTGADLLADWRADRAALEARRPRPGGNEAVAGRNKECRGSASPLASAGRPRLEKVRSAVLRRRAGRRSEARP